jgi:phage terminase large subunit-like protein
LIAVAYDRWRIEDFKKVLDEEGIELPLREWGQGFKDMAPALDALEDLVIDRNLQHGGHPVLTWNVANAVVDIDPTGARKLNKRRARARIDGLQALAMAVGLAAREPAPVEYDFDRPLVLSA